jgi:hypothetical protein
LYAFGVDAMFAILTGAAAPDATALHRRDLRIGVGCCLFDAESL